MEHSTLLLVDVLGAIVVLVGLIGWLRVNSFVALTLVALGAGLVAGTPALAVLDAFQRGVGETLGSVALVIGLGAILGQMLADSGGAERLATALIEVLGPRFLTLALALGGFVIGLPMFFTVGLVLLTPIVADLAKQSGRRLYRLGLPLVAGLSASHGLAPPHPGPLAAVAALHADMGLTLALSLAVGAPTALLCGLAFGWLRLPRRLDEADETTPAEIASGAPAVGRPSSAGAALFVVLLPVALMVIGTIARLAFSDGSPWARLAVVVGHPVVALLVAVFVSFIVLGFARGISAKQILESTQRGLAPIGEILLIVAAGGGLSSVLIASGAREAISGSAASLPVSPLVLAWLLAAAVRVATGSSTVAVSTAAGLIAPLAEATRGVRPELFVLALGAGSLVLSHVNDGGFWLVQKYLRLTTGETLRSWTLLETMISLVSLGLILVLSAVMVKGG